MKTLMTLFCLVTFQTLIQAQKERIVFSSDRAGNFDIYSMAPDGSDLVQLTKHPARDAWPRWSPDGKKIIFCSERYGKNQIMVMNADGSGLENISNNGENELDPVISPDGSKIAFINKESGSYQLHTMNIDGTCRRRLTNAGPFCGRPDWSPDSRRLVYLSTEDGHYEIYRINADGTDKKQLTRLKTEAGNPTWSKHGYFILFHAHQAEVDRLFRMKPDGSELKLLSKEDHPDFMGRWSAHYNKIVYTSLRDGNQELYKADMNSSFEITSENRLTTSNSTDSMADWFVPSDKEELPLNFNPEMPDHIRIAFTSYRGGSPDVFIMKPNGTDVTRLTDTDDANSFARDGGDGKSIIYRKAPSESGNVEKWIQLSLETSEESLYRPDTVVKGAREQSTNKSGTHVAYALDKGAFRELFVLNKITGEHDQITSHEQDGVKAMIHRSWWSHDGKKLAYLAGPDYYNLYLKVYDVVLGKTMTVTPRGYMFSGVVWLKGDQRFVLNISIRGEMSYELWAINLDGTDLQQLTNNPGRGNVHPQLSPDGNWIAFESGRNMDDGEIYLMRPDGSEQTRITFNKSYEGRPAWVDLSKK